LSGAAATLTGATSTPVLPKAAPNKVQARGDARGLNASGQIAGAALGLADDEADFRPFRWASVPGATTITGCCDTGWGADINDASLVAGTTQRSLIEGSRGFVAAGTSLVALPILPGADPEMNAGAVAINAFGQVAGYSPSPGDIFARHAVLWSPSGAIQDLGTLGGTNSSAIDVNDGGQVIGSSQIAGDGATNYFLWSASAGMQDLNTLLGAITSVVEINDAGQIIGTFVTATGASHAFLYTPGTGLRDLGTLGGTTSAPTGLNDAGQVVGSSTTASGETHAFFWSATLGMQDITAVTGITSVGRLNDRLQTLSGYVAPSGMPSFANATIPRLVQLDF
jgi:probable HAF family extracellular repeat protein